VDSHFLFFVLPDGTEESTDLNGISWQRTTDLNAERGVRVTLRTKSTQFLELRFRFYRPCAACNCPEVAPVCGTQSHHFYNSVSHFRADREIPPNL
jgi:hypothetical protein